MRRLALLAFLLSLLLTGCAGITEDRTKDWTVERFYSEAMELMNDGSYDPAIKLFEQLQGRFPYGRYAEQAQLEIAYAYYKTDEPALALSACDRFIRQYPTHPNVDYAYYLKGIVNFHGERRLVPWLIGMEEDMADHDSKATRESYDTFKELVQRYPLSRYAPDARLRVAFLFEALARSEVHVARYYYDRGAYVAAINRARYTLENFPRTPAVEDALGIQVLAYKKAGMKQLHEDTLRVLTRNFPQSPYLKELQTLDGG